MHTPTTRRSRRLRRAGILRVSGAAALVGAVAVLMCGVIDRPGTPSGQIALAWGWYVALAGALAMVAGAALRTSEHTARKPPGK